MNLQFNTVGNNIIIVSLSLSTKFPYFNAEKLIPRTENLQNILHEIRRYIYIFLDCQ